MVGFTCAAAALQLASDAVAALGSCVAAADSSSSSMCDNAASAVASILPARCRAAGAAQAGSGSALAAATASAPATAHGSLELLMRCLWTDGARVTALQAAVRRAVPDTGSGTWAAARRLALVGWAPGPAGRRAAAD